MNEVTVNDPPQPPSDDDPFGGDRDDFRQIYSFSMEVAQ